MDNLIKMFNDPPKKRIEARTCQTCAAAFEAKIYILKDRELDADRLCLACQKLKRDQDTLAALNDEQVVQAFMQRNHWRTMYGVTGDLLIKTFDSFETRLQPAAYRILKEYKGQSLVLLSPAIYGVGKTHLVCALANYLVDTRDPARIDKVNMAVRTNPCPVYFVTETELLRRVRNTFNNEPGPARETEEKFYRFINSFPLLIIDDIGKVKPRDMTFTQSVYFEIINTRYTSRRQLILTTNLDLAGLSGHIGEACADRLYEMVGKAGFITLKGTSYRKAAAGL